MPLHSIQLLPSGACLGLWHLQEAPADLWPQLPNPVPYRPLLPATTDLTRQAQWLAGRVLVHELLAGLQAAGAAAFPTPLWLTNDPNGRPQLVGWPQAAVSLSHSGAWVAALLAPGGRVGIDVELVRDKARRLAGRFLSDAELVAAQKSADPAVFSLLWSVKETLYKLAGQRGLIFREDILIDLSYPHFPALTTGELPATLCQANDQTRHRVCYAEPAPGYVLTYCYELNFSAPTPLSL
ncbi:4'-phosphopantetheinyl transferase family protein [uncultured Hymenobacter sp.]|uniref:4'-phosphopantetheinyl transferase family protein n=1 Tax=uncultured Hymenobacter sp. TaxID=170016 RepID=UPI0035CC7E19